MCMCTGALNGMVAASAVAFNSVTIEAQKSLYEKFPGFAARLAAYEATTSLIAYDKNEEDLKPPKESAPGSAAAAASDGGSARAGGHGSGHASASASETGSASASASGGGRESMSTRGAERTVQRTEELMAMLSTKSPKKGKAVVRLRQSHIPIANSKLRARRLLYSTRNAEIYISVSLFSCFAPFW